MNSEMWVVHGSPSSFDYWVEEGIKAGSFPEINSAGYFAFYAYNNSSGFTRNLMATITPNATVTDEYQISRSGTTNKWNVYFDGSLFTTPNVGFWSSSYLQVGGEVATPDATINTFNMYVKGINSASQRVNLGTQTGSFTPAQPGNPLNGVSYQNSEWSWNTKA